MSIRHRLYRLVRSEARSLEERLRELLEGRPPAAGKGEELPPQPPAGEPGRDEKIAGYYANLELPPGASLEEVKQAYRRLLSRYHPDRHDSDPRKRELANELTRQLREAYDALVEHLRSQGKA